MLKKKKGSIFQQNSEQKYQKNEEKNTFEGLYSKNSSNFATYLMKI